MIEKIISGGQTGADQAALDVALKYNIPCGGWIPRGRRTEAGPLPFRYRLSTMPTSDYRDRTLQNILDSQGTVVLYRNRLRGGSRLTRELAKTEGKPCVAVNLGTHDPFETALTLQSFVDAHQIGVLNVAGPRASQDPDIYMDVKMVLEIFVYLLFLERDITWPDVPVLEDAPAYPDSVQAAVDLVMSDLPLKSKTAIARLDPSDIQTLYFAWVDRLRFRLGLDTGNTTLVDVCKTEADVAYFTVEDAVMAVVKAVKSACDEACQLRVVK
ncbi:MAG: putative molybdenum carrier protein [Desulfotignum sp.]|nr:putative molybdenum carrier protein [Desulfotignum sp.]